MRKYYFQTKSFLKNYLLVKTLKAPFLQSFLLTFKDISSMKKTNSDYSSSLPYLALYFV